MRSAERREARRVRRGREFSKQVGQGHGEVTYVPVLCTNEMMSEATREARRERRLNEAA